MKTRRLFLASALVVGTLVLGLAVSPAEAAETSPQAQPVMALLKAAKEGDQELLKSAFSETMRKECDKTGWDTVMNQYQQGLKAAFGDYQLEDFTFDFKGSEEKGAVFVVHKGKPLPAMSVIRENAEWKLSER
jgi:hypothetical protein